MLNHDCAQIPHCALKMTKTYDDIFNHHWTFLSGCRVKLGKAQCILKANNNTIKIRFEIVVNCPSQMSN